MQTKYGPSYKSLRIIFSESSNFNVSIKTDENNRERLVINFIPRNKELMRIFKDLDLVEQLGSGIPRILEAYPKKSFHFSENFLRVILPSSISGSVTPQVTPQVIQLLKSFTGTHTRVELQDKLELSDREYFRKRYLLPAIESELVALTIPDKPTSSLQQYYLTEQGKLILNKELSTPIGMLARTSKLS